MGYRGKLAERARARDLRAAGWTYAAICAELAVSRSSLSLWVRDIDVDEAVWAQRVRRNKRYGARRRANTLALRRQAEIDRLLIEGRETVGRLSERDLLVAGVALYAGEGYKTDGSVRFANSDPRMVALFLAWLRHFFAVDESRLRLHLYLHQGLDLTGANAFWSELTAIPLTQFGAPYRAVPDPGIRKAKHPRGCVSIVYGCSRTHRAVMGFVHGLLSSEAIDPG